MELGGSGPEAAQTVSQGPTGQLFAETLQGPAPGEETQPVQSKLAEPVRKEFPGLSLLPHPPWQVEEFSKAEGNLCSLTPQGGSPQPLPRGGHQIATSPLEALGPRGPDLLGRQVRSRPGLTQTAVSPAQLHPPLDGPVQPSLLCLEGNV